MTSSRASCGVRASKGTRGSDDDAVPKITSGSSLCIPSGGFLSTRKNEATRGVRAIVSRDGIDHVEAREGGGSVKADQVPRGELWRAIKSTSSCFDQVRVDLELYCLIEDGVHPYRITDCDDPVPSRARQLNRDIAEVPRASDRNVLNVASSMMTAPLIKSGPYSGNRVHRLLWAKRTSVA